MSSWEPIRLEHGPHVATAIRAWDAFQARDHGRHAHTLTQMQVERGATLSGRPISRFARPRFVERAHARVWAQHADVLTSASRKVLTALRADLDRYASELGDFSPLERELIGAPYGFGWPDVSIRWDGFAHGPSIRFLELNGSVPGGLHWENTLAACYQALPAYAETARHLDIAWTDTTQAAWDAMLGAWRAWGGVGQPTVGITDWLGGEGKTETEFWLLRDWLAARGITAIVADPREWELTRGALTAQGVKVDLIDRRLMTVDLLARPDDCRVLIEAIRTNAACFVDPLEASLLHRKAFFALLTNPEHTFGFTAQEQASINETVPWTRRFTDTSTLLPDGTHGGLAEYVAAHAEQLVLKPDDDYGGHGLYLGWTMEPAEWGAAVDAALAADYVVQQRVRQVVDDFPLIEPFGDSELLYVDTNPYIAGGAYGGLLTRLSAAEVTNASQGGSLLPAFLVG